MPTPKPHQASDAQYLEAVLQDIAKTGQCISLPASLVIQNALMSLRRQLRLKDRQIKRLQQLAGEGGSGWVRVVFAAEVDESGACPRCSGVYADCPCPGPDTPGFEYEEMDDGFLWARPRESQ